MGTTLLLADDSITIQKVVGIIFANEDYELVVVDNGITALEKAKESRPDVMLVDALMPGKNGYEVCEEVRRDPALRDVPLLLLVGAFEPFDEERARNSGADAHITKPFESQSLIDRVKELTELGRSRMSSAPVAAPVEQPAYVAETPPEPPVALPETFEMPIEPVPTPPEPIEATLEPEISQPSEPAAKLAESFRGFVHLGGNVSAPVVEEPPVEVEPTVDENPSEPPAEMAAEPERLILLSTVDIIEAAPEDDPWGTFAEEVTEGEPIRFGEVLEGEEPTDPADTVEEIEPFTLLEDDASPVSFGAAVTPADSVPPQSIEAAAAEEFTFSEPPEEPSGFTGFAASELSSGPSLSGSISLGGDPDHADTAPVWEPEAEPCSAAEPFSLGLDGDDSDLPFAPEEEYVPAADFAAAPVAALETIEPGFVEPAAEPVVEKTVTLTEEQLAAAISRISREVIERIAWEVVPDLAETIIMDEIRKIKEGMSR